MSRVAAPDELHLEVDGTDLHPHTIDTRVAIDLVDAFVKLLDKVAASQDVPVYLRGEPAPVLWTHLISRLHGR